MSRKRGLRPFILSDAMILVATFALGLGLGLAQYRMRMVEHYARAVDRTEYLDRPDRDPIEPPRPSDPAVPSLPSSFESLILPSGSSFLPSGSSSDDLLTLPSPKTPTKMSPARVAEIASSIQEDRPFAIANSLTTFLALLSFGQLVLCLRKPRPGMRRLILRTSAIASLVTLFFVILSLAERIVWLVVEGFPSWSDYLEHSSYALISSVGTGVLLVWTGLVAMRRFHVRGWLDWSGLIVGLSWIALAAVDFCLMIRFLL